MIKTNLESLQIKNTKDLQHTKKQYITRMKSEKQYKVLSSVLYK